MTVNLSGLCIAPDSSIRQAIACIDRNGKGVVLVTDKESRLLGTITDGDVRRAMLAGESLDTSVSKLLAHKADSSYQEPVTARAGTDGAALLRLMKERAIRHVPLLDDGGHLVGLVTMDELVPNQVIPMQAIIMAGGYGSRLRPLTKNIPKPMLPVGKRPLLERIIEQLQMAGIRRVKITTHYKEELIAQHFGDGQRFGVKIQYVKEEQPLGTAGALSLLDTPAEPILVINGDILTQIDFRAMLDFHREHRANMTVAVQKYEASVPYGVMEVDGVAVTSILEKPVVRYFINAGIYLLNPEVCRLIPRGQLYNMPDLINQLLIERYRVVSFPIREYWIDIGHLEDYQKAVADTEKEEV